MKLELLQTKQNGAKENSQEEEKVLLSFTRLQKLTGVVPIHTWSHFLATLIKSPFSFTYMAFATSKCMAARQLMDK